MMGTEIFNIDAPWAEKLTKKRVQVLIGANCIASFIHKKGPSSLTYLGLQDQGAESPASTRHCSWESVRKCCQD